MSELKISNNAFLGKTELDRFKSSIFDEGFERLFKDSIRQYGVVRLASDLSFSALKVQQGSSVTKVDVLAGDAIDSNIDVIDVLTDQVDVLTIPSDSINRWVVISYATKSIEEGTVSITASGALTGTGTEFTKTLRGLPDYPSKISFPNSSGNTQEYQVASITSDTVAQLNVNSSMTIEAGEEYAVVGTFTPGIAPPLGDKFPFIRDSYTIELRNSATVTAGTEFLLAQVNSDGVTLTIVDLRGDNLFLLDTGSNQRTLSPTNALIGVELARFDHVNSSFSETDVKIGWGFNATTGNWSWSSTLNQISITLGSGGVFGSTTDFTTGDFDGWQVYFRDNGQSAQVLTSVLSGTTIVLTMGPVDSIGVTDIVVVPTAQLIEIESTPATGPAGETKTIHSIERGSAIIPLADSQAHSIKWRVVLDEQKSTLNAINDGSYYNETSFDQFGVLGVPVISSTSGGVILLQSSPKNARRYKQPRKRGSTVVSTGGVIDLSTDPLYLFNNLFDLQANVSVINHMTQMEEGTVIHLDVNNGGVGLIYLTHNVASPPSGSASFYIEEDILGFGFSTIETTKGYVASFLMSNVGGTLKWKYLGSSKDAGISNRFTLLSLSVSSILDAWNTHSVLYTALTITGGTISAGTINFRYKTIGKTVHAVMSIAVIFSGGTPTSVRVPLPAGMTISSSHPQLRVPVWIQDTATSANSIGTMLCHTGTTSLLLSKLDTSSSFAVNAWIFQTEITFEIN